VVRLRWPRQVGPPEPGATSPRFPGMRIREENCNMVLLATVTAVSVFVAGSIALLGSTRAQPAASKPAAYLADSTPVRVVGAPFVPNTDPHRR